VIRTDTEHQAAKTEAGARRERLRVYGEKLATEGYTPEEIEILMQPLEAFALELEYEVAQYERIRSGDVNEIARLRDLGRILIALRISKKITQRDLATRTGVAESQVSRDERHEYHGAKLERIARVFTALGAEHTLELTADGARIQGYVYDEFPQAEAPAAPLSSNYKIGLPAPDVRVSVKTPQAAGGMQFETCNDNLALVA
jgi:transcriptional regulator with XRE-family HTH domain